MKLKGVLFDFDDTIANTEESRLISINYVLKEFNVEISKDNWDEHFKMLNSRLILSEIKDNFHLDYDIEEMYKKSHKYREDYINENGMRLVEGFRDFLFFLFDNNIKVMVCSGGSKDHLEKNMEILDLHLDFVSIEDYNDPKPSPKAYLTGLSRLNLFKGEVVVFDDSYTGIQSANRAGIEVIGINVVYKEKIQEELETLEIIKDYTEIDKEKFLKILD